MVIDVKSFEQMQDALLLLKMLAQSEADYRRGRWKSHEEVPAHLEKRLRS